MTFIANDDLLYTIDMNDRTVNISEGARSARNSDYAFAHFNAEECETPEDVKEMIEDWIEDQS